MADPEWMIQPWKATWLKIIVIAVFAIWVLLIAAAHNLAIIVGGGAGILVFIGFLAAALGFVVRSSKRDLSKAVTGTLFSGHGTILARPLQTHPKWDGLRASARVGSISVQVEVGELQLVIRPLRNGSAGPVAIPWSEIATLTASPSPGKPLLGSVVLAQLDGANLRITVRDYRSFSKALLLVQGHRR